MWCVASNWPLCQPISNSLIHKAAAFFSSLTFNFTCESDGDKREPFSHLRGNNRRNFRASWKVERERERKREKEERGERERERGERRERERREREERERRERGDRDER